MIPAYLALAQSGERAVVASYGPHHGEEDPLRGWRGSGTIFFSRQVELREIADMMLELQARGCHNVNLVSPSHVVAQIIAAVAGDSALARKYSKVRNYVEVNRAAVKEMHRQVGDLALDERGIAQRGLLVRHLPVPAVLSGAGVPGARPARHARRIPRHSILEPCTV